MSCKNGTSNPNSLEIATSSCRCSTTSHGQEKEMKRIGLSNPEKKSRCTRRDSRRDIGRSSVLGTKRSGMEVASTNLRKKLNSVASQMVQRFKETGHRVFTSVSAFSREF